VSGKACALGHDEVEPGLTCAQVHGVVDAIGQQAQERALFVPASREKKSEGGLRAEFDSRRDRRS